MNLDLALLAAFRQALAITPVPLTYPTAKRAAAIVRANPDVSAEGVARIIGCSVFSVYGWLQGKRLPGRDYSDDFYTLMSILEQRARNLGIEIEDNDNDSADESVAAK